MPMLRSSAGNVSVACRVALEKLDLERRQIVAEDDALKVQRSEFGFWQKLSNPEPRGFMYDGRAIDLHETFYSRWVQLVERAKRITTIANVADAATDGVIYLDYDDLAALDFNV